MAYKPVKSKINQADMTKTKYIGVEYCRKKRKYYAFLNFHGYNIYINSSKDKHAMAQFFNNAAITYYDMSKHINIINSPGESETILSYLLREGDDEFMIDNFFDKGVVNYDVKYSYEGIDNYA